MKGIKKNLLMSLLLAGTFMFASTLTASASIVADGNNESKVERSILLDRMNLEDNMDILISENDQDPKKATKTTKKAKSKDAKEAKEGECKTTTCSSCSEKEAVKKAAKEKKKS